MGDSLHLRYFHVYFDAFGGQLYPSEYFCGYDMDIREYDITPLTISVHHYTSSWKKPSFKRKIQNIIKRIFGKKTLKKLIIFKRKLKNN